MSRHFRSIGIGLLLSYGTVLADQPIVIHEWGTFTSLQNERGDAIGGINVDTERLPWFVHNFAPGILPNLTRPGDKGLLSGKPRLDITMRLETPVIYFHLPPDAPRPTKLDLNVRFYSGWLTQFYPAAAADIDGRPVTKQPPGPILPADTSTNLNPNSSGGGLSWHDLQVGTNAHGPETTSRVWLAPRKVQADAVTSSSGEGEQYLFYRGVGHLDAPLRVSWRSNSELEIHKQTKAELSFGKMWLVDVATSGSLAYRTIDALKQSGTGTSLTALADFQPMDHSDAALLALKKDLHEALVADGLFSDEADALLNTWESSYFKSKGLRLFFLVPRGWTEANLPLSVSGNATIQRTMVGRIELVTPAQRSALRELAAVKTDLPDQIYLRECGKFYGQLGRFANALLLEEQKNHPSESITAYIRRAKLEANTFPGVGEARAR